MWGVSSARRCAEQGLGRGRVHVDPQRLPAPLPTWSADQAALPDWLTASIRVARKATPERPLFSHGSPMRPTTRTGAPTEMVGWRWKIPRGRVPLVHARGLPAHGFVCARREGTGVPFTGLASSIPSPDPV